MSRRVVVTGLGAVTPLGNDVAATWRGLVAGKSGVGPMRFPGDACPARIAGTVKDFSLDLYPAAQRYKRYLSPGAGFGVAALLQALADSGVGDAYPPQRRGIAMGASSAPVEPEELLEFSIAWHGGGGHSPPVPLPLEALRHAQTTGIGVMARMAQCQGPVISTGTVCAASAHAIGEAFRCIQDGEADMAVAGGFDASTTFLDILGFGLLGSLAADSNDDPKRGSRPFNSDRAGMVVGEGAVVVVLEAWEAARARGAPVRGELLGFGSGLDAWHLTDPHPDGRGSVVAMSNALEDAGLAPEGIDYVVAHGTGKPGGDLAEVVAIKSVFGAHAAKLAISSPKSMTGHLMCAAGGLNTLVALRAIQEGVIPPTINLDDPDPRLALDLVPNYAARREVRASLVNTIAFGGTNASLVVAGPR